MLQAESNTLAMFNPIGWCVDEAGGIWKALKEAFGEDTTKYRTVSCEKHYMWSVDNFKNALVKISKSGYIFKTLATRFMTANTKSEYDEAFVDLTKFIEAKPSKRDFLREFVNFWNPRRRWFSRAFKSSETPKTNLSKSYHTSHVKGHTTIQRYYFRCKARMINENVWSWL